MPQPGDWSPNSCAVVGFSLYPKQLPQMLSAPTSKMAAVTLHTLSLPGDYSPTPLPSLDASAAACRSDPQCLMLTSDGYMIGAYRWPEDVASVNAQIEKERQSGGPLAWARMDYCSGSCCGTWVADGLLQQLLLPATSSPEPTDTFDLPTDFYGGKTGTMDQTKMAIFCQNRAAAGRGVQPQTVSGRTNSTKASAGSPKQACPQHCRAACCARFAAGISDFDRQVFSQCSKSACADACDLLPPREPGPITARASAVAAVLKMEYLRASTAVPASGQQGTAGSNITVKLTADKERVVLGGPSLNHRH